MAQHVEDKGKTPARARRRSFNDRSSKQLDDQKNFSLHQSFSGSADLTSFTHNGVEGSSDHEAADKKKSHASSGRARRRSFNDRTTSTAKDKANADDNDEKKSETSSGRARRRSLNHRTTSSDKEKAAVDDNDEKKKQSSSRPSLRRRSSCTGYYGTSSSFNDRTTSSDKEKADVDDNDEKKKQSSSPPSLRRRSSYNGNLSSIKNEHCSGSSRRSRSTNRSSPRDGEDAVTTSRSRGKSSNSRHTECDNVSNEGERHSRRSRSRNRTHSGKDKDAVKDQPRVNGKIDSESRSRSNSLTGEKLVAHSKSSHDVASRKSRKAISSATISRDSSVSAERTKKSSHIESSFSKKETGDDSYDEKQSTPPPEAGADPFGAMESFFSAVSTKLEEENYLKEGFTDTGKRFFVSLPRDASGDMDGKEREEKETANRALALMKTKRKGVATSLRNIFNASFNGSFNGSLSKISVE